MRADASPLNLVFGASGYIGTHLVPVLQAAGKRVRATARNVEVLEAREWRDVDCVAADALRPETLERALAGVDTAFYLVHSMAAGRGFGALDRQAAANFGYAAVQAGVRRIVYLGGLIPEHARSEHLRSRAETGEVLRASGVPVTELRAGMIIGPGSAAYEVMRDLVNHLPVMTTPTWVRSRSTPIALDDLLGYLVGVAGLEAAAGRTFEVAGPETVTYEEIMRCYGRQVGRRPRIIAVPVLSPRISSYWLRLVTSVPVGIARALVEGLEHDFVACDDEIRHLLPRRLLGVEEAIRAAREADQRHAVVARWVEGSIACRNFRPEYAFYAKRVGTSAQGDVAPEHVFAELCTIGGDLGWFFADCLWWARRAVDWLA
ncbi:MAG TPA: NAD(P)H-binding protein, partial [Steroidobacteraceae bacterium]|nr:NAD(P)H-binding protein [Steroidobacteraceae bacterium]